MSRLVKTPVIEVIQEGRPEISGEVTKTVRYIGAYLGEWELNKLKKYINGYNYFFGSPPLSWFEKQKVVFGGKPPSGMEFDDKGNGLAVYWQSEQKLP